MILLIAYGNPLRQDDGAGLRLAERMTRRWQEAWTPLRHLAVQQLTPELAVDISAPEVAAVVFVDARAADGLANAVEITPLTPPDTATPSLGHHFQPDVLLAYAALLLEGRPAPPAWLVTAPGVDFAHGEGLSETASAAIEAAFSSDTEPLLRWMDELPGCQRRFAPPPAVDGSQENNRAMAVIASTASCAAKASPNPRPSRGGVSPPAHRGPV